MRDIGAMFNLQKTTILSENPVYKNQLPFSNFLLFYLPNSFILPIFQKSHPIFEGKNAEKSEKRYKKFM